MFLTVICSKIANAYQSSGSAQRSFLLTAKPRLQMNLGLEEEWPEVCLLLSFVWTRDTGPGRE